MADIAVLHDQFRVYGGAERVAVEIARQFDAPIYAMRVNDECVPDDVELVNLSGRVGGWCMRRTPVIQDGYQMLAWQHQSKIYDYDVVIETKTNPYWFVPKDTQTVVRYTHSTPRQMYDQWHRRYSGPLDATVSTVKRLLYRQTLPYADAWMANSDLVAHRMSKYFGLDEDAVDVVYPPVETKSFSPEIAETKDYLFSVGRLAINKRLDLLVDVAHEVDRPIKIAGEGPLRGDLEERAPENVEFLGYISEGEKARRLSEASATLFLAENEDFGIVPIESLASGTPVIGVEEGFTRHQIIDGHNGILCEPTVASVERAIETLDVTPIAWGEDAIASWTDRWFSVDRFRDEIQAAVERAVDKATVTPKFSEPVDGDSEAVELTMEGVNGD